MSRSAQQPRSGRQPWMALISAGLLTLVMVALAGISASPAQAGTSSFACLGANGVGYTQGNTPTNVMAGKLSIPGFGVTTIGTGDINFVGLNAGKDPTWQLWFNSLKWLEPMVASYATGQSGGGAHLNRAMAIAQDWVTTYPESTPGAQPAWNDQATSLRAQTLACMAKYRSDAWLLSALDAHGRHLADARNYSGDWNHGLEQNIGLLAVACIRDNSSWQSTAQTRAHNALITTIDSQGAFNEQAPGYGPWTITRWWTIDDVLTTCGLPALTDLAPRLQKLASFLAQATAPDGTLTQIGDTYAEPVRADVAAQYQDVRYAVSQSTAGVAPTDSVSIYNAGFVFSRSGWGTLRPFASENYFTMRFGPRRYAHGHFDHLSVTWFARGRKLLVDAGHFGYTASAYRTWIISAAAHNTLTVPSVPLRTYGTSKLTRSSNNATGQFYEVSDDAGSVGGAYQGLVRTRGVFVLPDAKAMVVLDRTNSSKLRWMYAAKAKVKTKWWHLDPSFALTSALDSKVTAVSGSTQLNVLQVPLPGEHLARGSQKVVRGAKSPYQGWVSTAQNRKVTALAVGQTTTGSRSLSVLVPGAVGQRVWAQVKPVGGHLRVDIYVGSTKYCVYISAGGSLYR